ncbi:unnamed protein product [Rhizophagus irregularis]|nr:unnamed protein product [Rhizophagus irregularis]
MMCVETGRPLILTDLEIIYGSLYNLWNQNYIAVGSEDNVKYFTRVALGAYANPMLYVSPNFKCILVMDEKNVASADPSLLNRSTFKSGKTLLVRINRSNVNSSM